MQAYKKLAIKIQQKKVRAAVVGLGYVGLPLVASICNAGLKTIALDIDEKKINMLFSGHSYISSVQSANIQNFLSKKLLYPTQDFQLLGEADVIIVCVPTPLDGYCNPDLSYVIDTMKKITKYLKVGQMVVLESTSYPGTMNEVVLPLFEWKKFKEGADYFLAYSPEREDPGNKEFNTSSIPKIVGASNKASLELATSFYDIFIDKVIPVDTFEVAEAAKITENIFRAVNIALINEIKIIYQKMGIDVWKVIEAMKTKPFGFMPFYPGPGLGGHCIPIDPFYLTWKAKELGIQTRFIELAGQINTHMPEYVVQKASEGLNTLKKMPVNSSKFLIVGIAYKKNVADQRETPAFPIMRSIMQKGGIVNFHDPLINEISDTRAFPEFVGMKSISLNSETICSYDCIIIVTDHDEVDYNSLINEKSIIIDTRNVFPDNHISVIRS